LYLVLKTKYLCLAVQHAFDLKKGEKMKKHALFVTFICAISFCSSAAFASLTATTNHTYISVANDAGVKYNNYDYSYYGNGGGTYTGSVGANAYLVKADGGGTNELGISSTTTGGSVQNIASNSSSPSGTFYITNSGGRGFDNDIILALAMTGPISDNFAVNIKSAGYTWTPATQGNYNPAAPTDATHVAGINETFTKQDLLYGPQTLRPGTFGTGGILPIFSSDNGTNPTTNAYLMFIDLDVGNIKSTTLPNLVDKGAVKVDFSFSGLDAATKIALNAYGWVSASNQNDGINFTNAMSGTAASGVYLNVTPPAPVPIPPSVLLFGSGLSGLFFFRRRKITA
jgi:hypothetical protein